MHIPHGIPQLGIGRCHITFPCHLFLWSFRICDIFNHHIVAHSVYHVAFIAVCLFLETSHLHYEHNVLKLSPSQDKLRTISGELGEADTFSWFSLRVEADTPVFLLPRLGDVGCRGLLVYAAEHAYQSLAGRVHDLEGYNVTGGASSSRVGEVAGG